MEILVLSWPMSTDFAATVQHAGLVLAQAVERFLGVPHIGEAFGVIRFFAVDFDGRERARVFLREFVSSGVVEDDRAIGPGNFDFQAGRGQHDELGVVCAEREVGLRPGFLDDKKVGVLGNVALEGVYDVDDGVRADLETQETGREDQDDTIGLGLDGGNGVERNPLSRSGRGDRKRDKEPEDGEESRRKNLHKWHRTPCTITIF